MKVFDPTGPISPAAISPARGKPGKRRSIADASWCGKAGRPEKIANRSGWQDIPAVRDGHIYEIKSTYILQPGPASLTEGVHQLHRIVARVAQTIADHRLHA